VGHQKIDIIIGCKIDTLISPAIVTRVDINLSPQLLVLLMDHLNRYRFYWIGWNCIFCDICIFVCDNL